MTAQFTAALNSAQNDISAHAGLCLSGEDTLHKAMRYAILGGKMLRGFLVLESARLHDVDQKSALNAALAIECVHAYSLIHDDLPAMDNDDMRRGQPTVHRAWDEATAILAGDSLLTFAFELLANPAMGSNALQLSSRLAKSAGKDGMVSGQMMDIAAETAATKFNLDQIKVLQARKTGCLIQWSATAGAVLAGANVAALESYAQALGLAFQITDDILDIEGDANTVGKALRKDTGAGKATFVSLLGIERAKAEANQLVNEACEALIPYGQNAETLKQAASFVVSRDK